MAFESKYARIEYERRFLVECFPTEAKAVAVRRIVDRYIAGTRLRLRHIIGADGNEVYKFTQKIPNEASGPRTLNKAA